MFDYLHGADAGLQSAGEIQSALGSSVRIGLLRPIRGPNGTGVDKGGLGAFRAARHRRSTTKEGVCMDKRYEVYCLADPVYYDHPAARTDREPDYARAGGPPPPGWTARADGDWRHVTPPDHDLPAQGWKIHVSATLAGAPKALDTVWDHCAARRLPFKFIRSPRLFFLRNSKYADRGSSGKLVTIYPADPAELERVLKELDDLLHGEPGPYILSDLRWDQGPLYVRYGGFVPRRCVDETGELVPAIEDPDGNLVPDRRGPIFAPPAWAALPDFLIPHLSARNAATTTDLPYQVEQALHFSNGGGVYKATDSRDGEPVVLKEGRPHAGLVGNGDDAVARITRERDVLGLVAGTGAAPGVRDFFTLGDHTFLALEFIEGRTLNSLFADRYPLTRTTPDPDAIRDYTAWALGIHEATERAVAALHERGVAFNDLHLFNIMVRPDDSVALIDFEVAAPEAECTRQVLASRAFQAPSDRTGFAVDRYALACLRLALFLPLTALLPLDRARAAAMAAVIEAEFPDVPRAFLDEAVREIAGPQQTRPPQPDRGFDAPGAPDWPLLRDALAAGISRSATPEREDRLFPGDIRQFSYPGAGLGLAYGAAGVLYALHSTGLPIASEYEAWLLSRAAEPPAHAQIGLYDGMHGVAFVLDLLGHRDPALRLIAMTLDEQWRRLGSDLSGGLAGIGLNLLHFARRTGDAALRDTALTAGRLAADRLGAVEDVPVVSGGAGPRAGLLNGSSGPALLFLRLFEETGDPGWLDHAETALRQDLRRCVTKPQEGTVHVNEGWRTMPYLARGSAGIGVVLQQYLQHRQHDGFAMAAKGIRRACTSRFYAQSGLFAGRAGMVLALAVTAPAGPPGPPDPAAFDQARRLAWHAVEHDGLLGFPGDQLHRLSADLATGSAGVLLALGAVFHDTPANLPFLRASEDALKPPAP
jgi:predicted Ser/Thr protein kinase